MNDLLHLGIILAFAVICLGIYSAVVTCIINRYNIGDSNDYGSSNEHVTITIKELAGLNPSVLRSISVVDFNSQDFKDGIECVVCLSELADGDKARVLPSCNHWFHAACIDSWFQSHSTCPICRKIVGLVQREARLEIGGDEGLARNYDPSSEPNGFPTNPSSMNTAVIEDRSSDEASEVGPV